MQLQGCTESRVLNQTACTLHRVRLIINLRYGGFHCSRSRSIPLITKSRMAKASCHHGGQGKSESHLVSASGHLEYMRATQLDREPTQAHSLLERIERCLVSSLDCLIRI